MDLSQVPEPLRSRIAEQLQRLPPEVRSKMEQQLGKLPLNQLEAVLKKTSPLLDRLAAKPGGQSYDHGHGSAGGSSAGASSAGKAPRVTGVGVASKTGSTTGQAPRSSIFDPHDHYNNTIQRGDRDSPPFFVIMFVIACVALFARALGWLG
jgi:hypothetical protein